MSLVISPSLLDDMPVIRQIYNEARIFQQEQFNHSWPEFSRAFITREIQEQRHYKIVANQTIAALFSVVYAEPEIWLDAEGVEALYLHRMAVRSAYRGKGYARHIINWAIAKGREQNRSFLRLDTWADNESLVRYYCHLGFRYCGRKQLPAKSNLPDHYNNIEVSLFEIPL